MLFKYRCFSIASSGDTSLLCGNKAGSYILACGWESHINCNDGSVGYSGFATQNTMHSDDNLAYSFPIHMPLFSVPSWTGSKFKFNTEMSGETDVFACSESRGTRRALLYPSDVRRLASLPPLWIWGSAVLYLASFSEFILVNGSWILSRTFATFSKLIFSCVSQPANMMNCGWMLYKG